MFDFPLFFTLISIFCQRIHQHCWYYICISTYTKPWCMTTFAIWHKSLKYACAKTPQVILNANPMAICFLILICSVSDVPHPDEQAFSILLCLSILILVCLDFHSATDPHVSWSLGFKRVVKSRIDSAQSPNQAVVINPCPTDPGNPCMMASQNGLCCNGSWDCSLKSLGLLSMYDGM